MIDNRQDEIQRKRAQAVKTALVLGLIALAIFATFIGSAVLNH
jgi:hypothetical protein